MTYEGKLLIAPPNIVGNFWEKTVIFITGDHEQGSTGLVLNKTSKMTIKDFGIQCGVKTSTQGYVYIGGPINVNAITLLHTSEWSCGNTLQINERFSISSSSEVLRRLAVQDTPLHWRLMCGMCTWNKNQLEDELHGNPPYMHDYSWLTSSASYLSVFGHRPNEQWDKGIEQSAIEFSQNMFA